MPHKNRKTKGHHSQVELYLIHAMKTLWVVQVQLHAFLTFALDGCEWLTSRPGRCTLGKEHRCPQNSRPGAQPGTGSGFHYWIAIFETSLISKGHVPLQRPSRNYPVLRTTLPILSGDLVSDTKVITAVLAGLLQNMPNVTPFMAWNSLLSKTAYR